MEDFENNIPETKNQNSEGNCPSTNVDSQEILLDISQIKDDVSYLRDLFVRRLNDDKQKNAVIQKLAEGASYAFIEPFLYDIILLLDRLEKSDDDFVISVKEELYGILNRRGVQKIKVTSEFNPAYQKAVKVKEDFSVKTLEVTDIIRNGYTLSGNVIRPAEVIVVKPASFPTEKGEG